MRPDAIGSLDGKYVFGDFRKTAETETPTGSLFAATPTEEGLWELEELTIENTESGTVGAYVLAIGRDNDGGLYVLTSVETSEGRTGAVHRIRPPQNAAQHTTVMADNGSAGNATADNSTLANATTANTTAGNGTTGNATTTAGPTTNATTANATVTTDATTTTNATPLTSAATTVTESDGTAATATGTTAASGTATVDGNASTADAAGSSGSGPGFGVLAALSGLTIGAARLLSGRDGE